MNKSILDFSEHKEFVVCSFEISDLKIDEIDKELNRLKGIFKKEWIDHTRAKGNNIKCQLWISNKKDLDFAKKNLIIMLKKEGYNWKKEENDNV